MRENKYLSDGRKVSVIGKININEYIVQEIFITKDGSEIPSGENFTTKSLHDAPVESWKEKNIKDIDKTLNKKKAEIERFDIEIKKKNNELKILSETIKRSNFVKDKIKDFDWDYFADILTGQMKYAVSVNYSIDIYEAGKVSHYNDDRLNFEDLKAIIIKNKWSDKINGREYSFNINQYPDGSGSSTEFKFFKNVDDMQEYLLHVIREKMVNNSIGIDHINKIEKHFKIPDEIKKVITDKHNEKTIKRYDEQIKSANKILEGLIK